MWVFERTSGALAHNDVLCGFGYAGHGDGVNDPAMEMVHNVGPIPAGKWTIGPFFHHPFKGPLCADLEPVYGTETYGRTGFMIHGDNHEMNRSASEGCIVLARPLREQICASEDSELEVQ